MLFRHGDVLRVTKDFAHVRSTGTLEHIEAGSVILLEEFHPGSNLPGDGDTFEAEIITEIVAASVKKSFLDSISLCKLERLYTTASIVIEHNRLSEE